MTASNRVVWTEGMFLRPQHMQQADRWTEAVLQRALHASSAYPWGLTACLINTEALEQGTLSLQRAAGFLPDGTDFDTDDEAGLVGPLPSPIEPDPDLRDAVVYLAAPARRVGAMEFASDDATSVTRYRGTLTDTIDVSAASDASERPPIEVGRLNLSLKTSADDLQGWSAIPFTKIIEREANGKLVLDDDFIPTVMTCSASPRIMRIIQEVSGMVEQRAEAQASQLGTPTAGGASEVRDFLLMQLLNGAGAELAHVASLDALHPERLYTVFYRLASELATFSGSAQAGGDAFKRPQLDVYKHGDLTATFEAVLASIQAALARRSLGRVLPIPLEHQGDNLYTGQVTDRSVFGSASFVLVASAAAPKDKMMEHLPNLIKVSSVESIQQLVHGAVPAVPLKPLPIIPRQLPPDNEAAYFEIDVTSPSWQELERSAGVAVHVSQAPRDLRLQMYAIRSA
ncbi:MAG: type VI secretion system baseplate subunit TssK [Pseudomonadota bacterium]